MPIIAYACDCGKTAKKFYRQVAKAPAVLLCEYCNKENMKKQLSAPNSTSTVIVDNGVQARAVEVNPEIIRINQERANKNYSED
jgi:hypothetical protein